MGTVRKNWLKLPKFIANEKLGISQFTFRRKENMLVVRYQDKKQIFLLSTMCKADIVNVRKRSHGDVQKPKVIHDYNQKMEGVDINDVMTWLEITLVLGKPTNGTQKYFSISLKKHYIMPSLFTVRKVKRKLLNSCCLNQKPFVKC